MLLINWIGNINQRVDIEKYRYFIDLYRHYMDIKYKYLYQYASMNIYK